MGIVLGKNESLWHLVTPRKGVRQYLVAELLQHGSNLALGNDIAVELIGGISEVLVKPLQPLRPGELVASPAAMTAPCSVMRVRIR